MAQNVNPTFVKTPNLGAVQITTGTGSSVLVTVYTGAANGSKVAGLIATAVNTTASFDVQWGVTSSGGTFYMYEDISIPAGAGSSNTTPPINLMSTSAIPLTWDSDGMPYLILASSGWSLQAKTPATSSAWTTGAVINLIAPSVGDF